MVGGWVGGLRVSGGSSEYHLSVDAALRQDEYQLLLLPHKILQFLHETDQSQRAAGERRPKRAASVSTGTLSH